MCHDSGLTVVKNAINAGRSNVNGFMGSASVVNCDTCHVTDHDFASGDATWDLATLDTAAIKDDYGRGHGTSPDTVHGEHNNLANSTGSQAQAGVPTYTGKLSGAYGGLLAADYNCNDCHDIDSAADAAVVKQQKRIQEHNLGNCLLCHGYANVTDEIAAGAGSAPFDEGTGGTVTNCETCHAAANNPTAAANDTYMYQYDGTRHHTTSHAQAGDCTWCHGDPRPAAITDGFAATAGFVDGDGDGNTLNDGWLDDYNTATPTPIPKQAACRLCHTNYGTVGDGTPWSVNVDSTTGGNHGYNMPGFSGTATERTTGLTVYANDFNAGGSGATDSTNTDMATPSRVTQAVLNSHRIIPNNGTSMIKVYDYGACLGCHSVQVMHAAPVPGADYPALTGGTIPNIERVPWDTLRYAPGRAIFNRLRGSNDNNQAWNNHRLENQNGIQTLYGQGTADPRGKNYIQGQSGGTDWYFGQQITHSTVTVPLHATFSNFDAQAGSQAVYFTNIAAPVIPDTVQIISASWNGTVLTVEAVNDDGCGALTIDWNGSTSSNFTGTTLCTGTLNSATYRLATVDVTTSNAAGTNATGFAVADNSCTTATVSITGTPSWTPTAVGIGTLTATATTSVSVSAVNMNGTTMAGGPTSWTLSQTNTAYPATVTADVNDVTYCGTSAPAAVTDNGDVITVTSASYLGTTLTVNVTTTASPASVTIDYGELGTTLLTMTGGPNAWTYNADPGVGYRGTIRVYSSAFGEVTGQAVANLNNDAPVIGTPPADFSIVESTTKTDIEVTSTVTDTENDQIRVTAFSDDCGGTVNTAIPTLYQNIGQPTNISWTAPAGAQSCTLSYTVADAGGSFSDTIVATVTAAPTTPPSDPMDGTGDSPNGSGTVNFTAIDGQTGTYIPPAGTDVLIVAMYNSDTAAADGDCQIGGATATMIIQASVSGGDNHTSAHYVVVSSTDGTTGYNVDCTGATNDSSTVGVMAFQGVHQTTSISSSQATTNDGGACTFPTIQVPTDGRAIYMASGNTIEGNTNNLTPPTNGGSWTEVVDWGAASNAVFMGYRDAITAQTDLYVNATWNNTPNRSSCIAFSLAPSP
jgi:hypothetical protein